MFLFWKQVIAKCDAALDFAAKGELEARFYALLEAQAVVSQADGIMRQIFGPSKDRLYLLDDFVLRYLEVANITGETRCIEQGRELAVYVGEFWRSALLTGPRSPNP